MAQTTTIMRAYRYRLLPNEEQEATLRRWCAAIRSVYNAAIEQRMLYGRIEKLKKNGELRTRTWLDEEVDERYGRAVGLDFFEREIPLGTFGQIKQTTKTKLKEHPELDWMSDVPSKAIEIAVGDADKAFKNFFQGRAKYSSWRRSGENDSFTVPTFGNAAPSDKRDFVTYVVYGKDAVRLPNKVGRVKYIKHRQFRGRPKTTTVIYDAGKWFISVACEITISNPLSSRGKPAVGLDMGVAKPVTLSDGTFHLPDEGLLVLDKRKRKLQRDLARCKKGSARRLRRRMKVSKISRHIADRRKANNHEITTDITRRFSTIVIEDLKVSNMTRSAKGTVEEPGRNVKAKSGLNRAILNVAPFQFRAQLEYKILSTGGEIISVDPKFTSQTCNVCGVVDAKSRRSQDKFKYTSCGYEENADINAARVILARGLNLGSVSGALKTPSELRRSRKTQRPATSKPHASQSLVGVTQQNRGAVTSKIEGKTDV